MKDQPSAGQQALPPTFRYKGCPLPEWEAVEEDSLLPKWRRMPAGITVGTELPVTVVRDAADSVVVSPFNGEPEFPAHCTPDIHRRFDALIGHRVVLRGTCQRHPATWHIVGFEVEDVFAVPPGDEGETLATWSRPL